MLLPMVIENQWLPAEQLHGYLGTVQQLVAIRYTVAKPEFLGDPAPGGTQMRGVPLFGIR